MPGANSVQGKVLCLKHAADGNGVLFTSNDGGRPMRLDGNIVLCDHSDVNFPRGYNGALRQLSLYDSGFNQEQVYALYQQVSKSSAASACKVACQCVVAVRLSYRLLAAIAPGQWLQSRASVCSVPAGQ